MEISLHFEDHNFANKSLSIDLCFINHPQTYMSDASYQQKLSQIRLKYGHANSAHPEHRTIPTTPRRTPPPTIPAHQTNFNPLTPRNTHTARENDRSDNYYDQIDTHRQRQNGRGGYPMKEMAQQPRMTDRNMSYALQSPGKAAFSRESDRPCTTRTQNQFYLPQSNTKMQSYSPLKEYSRNQIALSPTFKSIDVQQHKPSFFYNKGSQNETYQPNFPLQTPYFQAGNRFTEAKQKMVSIEEQPCDIPTPHEKRNLSPTPHSFKNLTIDITEEKGENESIKQPEKPVMFSENIKNIDKIKEKIQAALHRNKHIK